MKDSRYLVLTVFLYIRKYREVFFFVLYLYKKESTSKKQLDAGD